MVNIFSLTNMVHSKSSIKFNEYLRIQQHFGQTIIKANLPGTLRHVQGLH